MVNTKNSSTCKMKYFETLNVGSMVQLLHRRYISLRGCQSCLGMANAIHSFGIYIPNSFPKVLDATHIG